MCGYVHLTPNAVALPFEVRNNKFPDFSTTCRDTIPSGARIIFGPSSEIHEQEESWIEITRRTTRTLRFQEGMMLIFPRSNRASTIIRAPAHRFAYLRLPETRFKDFLATWRSVLAFRYFGRKFWWTGRRTSDTNREITELWINMNKLKNHKNKK